ncbi:MAG: ABC transporter permease subunit [Candidatus Poribacteria bacterium]
MKNVTVICRKELLEISRDKKFIIPCLLMPVGMPIMLYFITLGNMKIFQNTTMGYMFPLGLMLLGLLATMFSLGIAVESFVGEKERKTIEPLLATPLSELELFVGKCIAATILPVVATYVAEVVFIGLVALHLTRAGEKFTMAPGQILFIIILMPLLALLMCSFAVTISTRWSSVKSANQFSTIIALFPLMFLFNFGPVILPSNKIMILVVATLVIVDALAFYIGSRVFLREKLVSTL